MHILILNYEYPPIGGGAGVVTKHLAQEFIAEKHKVTIITTWYNGEPEYYTDNLLTIIRLKTKRRKTYESNPIEMFLWMRATKSYLSQLPNDVRIDVCLANFTLPGGYVAQYLKKKFNIPYVILSHGHDIPWAFPKVMFLWHLICYLKIKSICNDASYTIVLSEEIKKMADNLNPSQANKNIVLKNGLYTDTFKSQFKGDKLKIVFVGRLVEQKNPLLFLEVIKIIDSQLKLPYEVTILGDGMLRNKMLEYIHQHQLQYISFLGKVSHSEVLHLLNDANLLLSTSFSEGMSLAILEAISSGVYVIATNVSGNDSMIINDINGTIVDSFDASKLADAVNKFYQQKLLKQYTFPDLYIQEIEQKFSWKHVAQQYLQLFKQIV